MHARVAATERLTPSLVRVVLEGGDLAELEMPDAEEVRAGYQAVMTNADNERAPEAGGA